MRTVASLKSDLTRKLHGTSLSKVEGVYDVIAEAGRNVLSRLDPQETTLVQSIENALFDDVYLYTSPSNLKGDKVIDIRPITDRTTSQNFTKVGLDEFDRNKTNRDFTVAYRNGQKFLKVSYDVSATKTTLSSCESTSGWSVSSSGTNLSLDKINFLTGEGSLNFDVDTSTTTAIIENSTLTSVDLSDFSTQNSAFVWLYIPDATKVTSIQGKLGSSSSNYYSISITGPHTGSAFTDGWNLLRFDYEDATETGTTDWTAINYFQMTITHDQTGDTNFRLDSVLVGVGEIWEVVFYGDAIFKGADGSYKKIPTLDTDIIQLEEDAYNILLYELSYLLSQELQGENGSFDESYFRRILDGDGSKTGLYKQYHMSYPSQNKKMRSYYYKLKRGNYRY